MKLIAIFTLLTTLAACSSVTKNEEVTEAYIAPERSELIKILLSQYQAIAGAWYIEKNCQLLGYKRSQQYEKYVADLNVFAQTNKIAPQSHLYQMQRNGRTGASLGNFAKCGQQATTMVEGTYKVAEALHKDLIQNKSIIG